MDLKEQLGLDTNKPIPADFSIPYYVHEDDLNREEHHSKRFFIAWLITFIALILTNVGWLVYESRYEDVVTETYTAETDQGGAAIANGDGSVTYGESKLQED
jgi:hypothetical protein